MKQGIGLCFMQKPWIAMYIKRMKSTKTPKLELTEKERSNLRKHRLKISEILDYGADELEVLLGVCEERAREVYALADFQRIPTVGIRFAQDLVFLGYGQVADLKGGNPAALTDAYELKKGYQTDPCVEDQFRLAVHFANTADTSKKWWDFTPERKKYRQEFGYPPTRPVKIWIDVLK
jgi:hypothetical protein